MGGKIVIKIQLTFEQILHIQELSKIAMRINPTLSSTIEISVFKECKNHLGGDSVEAKVKSLNKTEKSYIIY